MSDTPAGTTWSVTDAVSLGANMKTLLGIGSGGAVFAAGFAMRRYYSPPSKTVRPLFAQMGSSRLRAPIIQFSTDPYAHVEPYRALILQGRNKEGKTTLLATSIPLRKRFIFPLRGIYLNGAEGTAVDTFSLWLTTQMYGMQPTGGSEIRQELDAYLNSHRLRKLFDDIPIAPQWMLVQRPIVIVDQFEELMKRFPEESLQWANQLTNAHVRDNKARVIFVVNSDEGTKSIQGLNQGDRWNVLKLCPPGGDLAGIDSDRFDKCQHNIGLYKEAEAKKVDTGVLEQFADETLALWRQQYHVPYPLLADKTWRLLTKDELKADLPVACEKALRAEKKKDGSAWYTEDKIKTLVDAITMCIDTLNKEQILSASQAQWEEVLRARATTDIAKGLAPVVKEVLGKPKE